MTAGHLIKIGAVSLGLLAVPAGIDTRALIVDSAGAPMGTVGNPVNVTGSSGGGAVTQGTTPWLVAGQLTHNNAIPAANNVGVLPAIANAASPTFTEGNQSLLSTDLSGLLRAKAAGFQAVGTAIASNPMIMAGQFSGNVKLLALDTNGGIQQGTQNGAGAASWNVQGAGAATAAVTGNPVPIGGRDAAGTAQYIGGNNSGVFAQGPAAAGAVVAGNPVLMGAWDGTNVQYLKMSDTSNNLLKVQIGGGVNVSTVANTATDGLAAGVNLYTAGFPLDFNGTTWDRHRNNADATVLASAARTTTQTVAVTTYNAQGIIVYVNVTSAGTGSITPSIQYVDPVSGATFTILTGTAITTNTTQRLEVCPGITATANVSASDHVSRVVNVVITANNANSVTYSVGSTLLN